MKVVTVAHLLFALVHIVGVRADGQCLSRLDNNVNYINKDIRKPATGVGSACGAALEGVLRDPSLLRSTSPCAPTSANRNGETQVFCSLFIFAGCSPHRTPRARAPRTSGSSPSSASTSACPRSRAISTAARRVRSSWAAPAARSARTSVASASFALNKCVQEKLHGHPRLTICAQ